MASPEVLGLLEAEGFELSQAGRRAHIARRGGGVMRVVHGDGRRAGRIGG
jgi:hypothetical protein